MDFGDVEYWERFYRRYLPPAKPPGEGEAALSTGADRGSGGAEQQLLEQYEWYLEASALVPRLLPCLPSLAEEGQLPAVLMLGCGSSRLSELLYEAGYHHITNVDFSPLVIASMQEKTRSACPTLQWLVADVTHMPAIASSRWPPPLTFRLSGRVIRPTHSLALTFKACWRCAVSTWRSTRAHSTPSCRQRSGRPARRQWVPKCIACSSREDCGCYAASVTTGPSVWTSSCPSSVLMPIPHSTGARDGRSDGTPYESGSRCLPTRQKKKLAEEEPLRKRRRGRGTFTPSLSSLRGSRRRQKALMKRASN